MRAAVIGHVEWIDFVALSTAIPEAGIVHADASWEAPGGGGSVAALELARLAGGCSFYTALGDDTLGRRARDELLARGIDVHATFRPDRQRRALTFIDPLGERTIVVLGDRMEPRAADPLPWDDLAEADAVYVCAADAAAIRLARHARTLVGTARILDALTASGVMLDAIVGSATDPSERYADGDLDPPPRIVVRTDGARGGVFRVDGGPEQRYEPAAIHGAVRDTYGAGDSFAAGLAHALADGLDPADAVAFAAACGARALTRRGVDG